jgi:alkylhydroperoxidase family enzyme
MDMPRVGMPETPTGDFFRDSPLGHVPETIEHYIAINAAIWEKGPLSAAELELARLRNANKVNCVFCKRGRYDIAKTAGLTEEKAQMVNDQFQTSELSEREKLIISFCDYYLDDPTAITKEDQRKLLDEFTPEELAHLSMAIVLFNAFSRFAVSIGGMPGDLPVYELTLPR